MLGYPSTLEGYLNLDQEDDQVVSIRNEETQLELQFKLNTEDDLYVI